MTTTARAGLVSSLALCATLGCTSESIDKSKMEPATDSDAGVSLALSAGPAQRTFVELSTPTVVPLEGDGSDSIAWDIALQGREIFTNGGISGPGNSSAFGPLSPPTFLSDSAPEVPLMLKDRAGGAFLDWYDYAGQQHQLFSRYHVYGIKDGERFFKLQILSYYGEKLGAPVAALYHVRYAEVTADGVQETHDVRGIDATAGGSKDDDKEPSACLDFDSEEVAPLTPKEAAASDAWHVCFRREAIAVNGGLSGPRSMAAVDLQADTTADETESEIQKRTAETEQPRFDAVDFAALSDDALSYRPDGVVTAFGQRWLEPGSDPLALSDDVWLVIAADGKAKYLLKLEDLVGDPADAVASLRLTVKSVR